MKQVCAILMIGLIVITGCTEDNRANSTEPQQTSPVHDEPAVSKATQAPKTTQAVITENLEVPWSIEKLGDTFYVTERPGTIVTIENGSVVRHSLELEKQLAGASEAGLLGFVLAPDFSETHLAYAYYTYEEESGQYNRMVTLRMEEQAWKEERLLLDRIPSGSVHHGGRLEIGPDRKLYATVGDASESEIAQNPNTLGGKILRMNLDGSIPSDNPFPNSYVYSYGHRNPQGMTWLPDGTMYASEHGNNANDEVNQIKAGSNYGWPVIQGDEKQEGMITPIFTSGDGATWAPSGMDHNNGKLFVATLRGEAILEFDLQTGKSREVVTGLGRVRDVLIEDNILYFISNNSDGRGTPQENDDKLYRITLPE
ncbi:PQQ-dependent sugar dehydrogenase [Paenibacillus wynnii]|uniref:Quinoprotein glucose dehydrogenase n=1 Tax=Paenibacillus wynnii TaxID=268407 RepID=A0A098M3H5_9BACL|nr:sorbosone dehydrogenase family protein [Paenibacillus wynnii]KGE17080.1 quinoprotein glucose dehydrogenase [Paenibacillus wynnii]